MRDKTPNTLLVKFKIFTLCPSFYLNIHFLLFANSNLYYFLYSVKLQNDCVCLCVRVPRIVPKAFAMSYILSPPLILVFI